MKKKSITYTDLSKKQLQHLKELYIQKKVECMSHKELIIPHVLFTLFDIIFFKQF